MWIYDQHTGKLYHDLDENNPPEYISTGYSGTGPGRNNPLFESKQGVGPIPKGRYNIGSPRDSVTLGPLVMDLTPHSDTNTFGRSLFRIHGNNSIDDASHGCIILGPAIRQQIASSKDNQLLVK
jgi:Protein of unknown function (DUF2778)